MVVDKLRSQDARRTDRLLHALADATRRDIVTRTLAGDRCVSELARLYPMSFAAVQKHVAVLADAGLVSKRRSGREQLVRGELGRVQDVHRLLEQLEVAWRDRLDRFGAVLDDKIDDNTTRPDVIPPTRSPRRKKP